MNVENARLKLELTERQKALSNVRRSVSTLQHRLSLLMTANHSTDSRPRSASHRHQLDVLSQAIHNIARQVLRLSAHRPLLHWGTFTPIWVFDYFSVVGGIALAVQAIPPIPTHFSVAWSVCLSSVCLSHSCTVLKPFDGFRCHLAGTLVWLSDTLCCMEDPDPLGKGRFGGQTARQNMQLLPTYEKYDL